MKLLKSVSTARNLSYTSFKMPLLWGNREMVCKAFGVTDYDKKNILTCVKSVNEGSYFGLQIPEPAKDFVRIDLVYSYYYIEYLGPNKTRMVFLQNMDLKLGGIPDGLIDTLMKETSVIETMNVIKFSKQVKGGEYEKRMKEKPDIYQKIQEEFDS